MWWFEYWTINGMNKSTTATSWKRTGVWCVTEMIVVNVWFCFSLFLSLPLLGRFSAMTSSFIWLFIEFIAPIHQTLANVCVNGFKWKFECNSESRRKKIKYERNHGFACRGIEPQPNMLTVFHDLSRWYNFRFFNRNFSSCFDMFLFEQRFNINGGSRPNRMYHSF